MAQLSAHELVTIFLALAVLLGVARALGELARWFHQPAVLGEILAGVLLGPTVLGRLAPGLQADIFPTSGGVALFLSGISSLAVTLFLLVAGMEVDLSAAFRQGAATVRIAVWGMLAPFILGWAFASAFPDVLMAGSGPVFPIFFATALSISALPVVAKILKDLNLIKTDLGAVIVAAATINDLCGWMLFAVVLGLVGTAAGTGAHTGFPIIVIIELTLAFVAVMLTAGRWTIHKIMPFLQAHTSWPAGVMGFALTGALLCASFTEYIGIHAIFGAFIFGVAFGDSSHLRERTRATLDQFISFIFAPLFFATIGLKVDFISNFSLVPVLVVLAIAVFGKLAGCYAAGVFSGLTKRESLAIGFAENARGAMEIILGLLALHAGIIDEKMFVALVLMAFLTSAVAGWTMEKVLNRPKPLNFVDLLSTKGFVQNMTARNNKEAIAELSVAAAAVSGLDEVLIREKVLEREALIATGLPGRVAIPHARISGLPKPVVVLGHSGGGVDFDSSDGHVARFVFLILTPDEDPRSQLEIIAGIAREFDKPNRAEQLSHCDGFTEMLAGLKVAE
jgi:Kef-type K+ transport system membrane component KefB/mannitol/fructose-specific phosphotransferase system IIA component (Ntr-type)